MLIWPKLFDARTEVLDAFAIVLFWRLAVLRQTSDWVQRADTVIARANYTVRLAVDAETGQRGYLVSHGQLYLEPYEQATNIIDREFDRLHYLARRTPAQATRVDESHQRFHNWPAVANTEIAMPRDPHTNFRDYFHRAGGKTQMDALRAKFSYFIAIETEIRDRRFLRMPGARGHCHCWETRSLTMWDRLPVATLGTMSACCSAVNDRSSGRDLRRSHKELINTANF
jgi:CHASE3 domain sensor protein